MVLESGGEADARPERSPELSLSSPLLGQRDVHTTRREPPALTLTGGSVRWTSRGLRPTPRSPWNLGSKGLERLTDGLLDQLWLEPQGLRQTLQGAALDLTHPTRDGRHQRRHTQRLPAMLDQLNGLPHPAQTARETIIAELKGQIFEQGSQPGPLDPLGGGLTHHLFEEAALG